ncbi:MAG: hypothetical protein EAX95_16265 [Candidatus Thorarchaeota archaeon]|nr:hypothetical protein [Candidatus Thorarchaeota archaeon]
MQSLESLAAYGAYIVLVGLVFAPYAVMRRLRLRAILREGVPDGEAVVEFKQWQLRLVTSRYSRALEWMLFTISAVLQIGGFLYWNHAFAEMPGLHLAQNLIWVLAVFLGAAMVSLWMEQRLRSKMQSKALG